MCYQAQDGNGDLRVGKETSAFSALAPEEFFMLYE
jgi:hypothetical protein